MAYLLLYADLYDALSRGPRRCRHRSLVGLGTDKAPANYTLILL